MIIDKYLIKWEYVNAEFMTLKEIYEIHAITNCRIFLHEENKSITAKKTLISGARASCSPLDNFDKEIGRKLSLKRAIENGNFDKETRKSFWEGFRTLTKKPKW